MSIRCVLFSLLVALSTLSHAQTPAKKPAQLELASVNAMVIDLQDNDVLYSRNADVVVPIASVSKLMTAMVVLDDKAPLDEWIAVDVSKTREMKNVFSHVRIGSQLKRKDMLLLALMASENRAAATLAHHYSKGYDGFIAAMNAKAKALGMTHTHFVEPTGLSEKNVSTARDLARMVQAANRYALITELSTTPKKDMYFRKPNHVRAFYNTNPLVRAKSWDIAVSKTGFINEAGRCLVMLADIQNKPTAVVLLDSFGKRSHFGDANRIKRWIETGQVSKVHPAARDYVQRKQKALLAQRNAS